MANPEFETLVTIPMGEDVEPVRKHRGCRFEPTGVGLQGTHGMLVAKDQSSADTLAKRVLNLCNLRPGL
jgi:hypothetical protein